MNTQVAITHRATETLQAAIAGHVTVPGEVGYDQARQAWNLASDQRPSVVVLAESPTDVVHAVQFAHAHGMRIAMPGTLHYHSISCACEQCIRMDERIPSVSPPVTIAFDADELCGYYEFHLGQERQGRLRHPGRHGATALQTPRGLCAYLLWLPARPPPSHATAVVAGRRMKTLTAGLHPRLHCSI
jgi:hypothetical protein